MATTADTVAVSTTAMGNTSSKACFAAARDGDRPALQSLLAASAIALEIEHGEKGDTALIAAARHGHKDCMSDLMAAGVNIETVNAGGATALYIAAQSGHEACMTLYVPAVEGRRQCGRSDPEWQDFTTQCF